MAKVSKSCFTVKGYNDKPRRCVVLGCRGKIRPTVNANVGRCDTCDKIFNWGDLKKQRNIKKG